LTVRRFPPPWAVEEKAACFVIRDHGGQALHLSISRMSLALRDHEAGKLT
jgi:Fe2+ transport system protein FeoA